MELRPSRMKNDSSVMTMALASRFAAMFLYMGWGLTLAWDGGWLDFVLGLFCIGAASFAIGYMSACYEVHANRVARREYEFKASRLKPIEVRGELHVR